MISPNIDKIASSSMVFDQAITESYWTLPIHATIITGRYPFSHGLLNRNQKLVEEIVTLQEIFKKQGYKTAAFTCGLALKACHRLDQDFEYCYYETRDKPYIPFKSIVPLIKEWIEKNQKHPFLLYIQSYDAHDPYSGKDKDLSDLKNSKRY